MGEDWRNAFTEREMMEIQFAREYAARFNHGTDGHNAKIIIAKLVAILDINPIENVPPMSFAPSVKG